MDNQAIADFLLQAMSGPIMAMMRLRPEITGKTYTIVIRQMFYKYLNDCWMALMNNNDGFVTESFERMGHRSPVCLIQIMAGLANNIFPEEPYAISTTTGTLEEQLDVKRTLVRQLLKVKLTPFLEKLQNHDCCGATIAAERQRWTQKGCPQENFFEMHLRTTETPTDPETPTGRETPANRICNVCHSKEAHLKKCARCRQRYYCSVQCQQTDWPTHKSQCVPI